MRKICLYLFCMILLIPLAFSAQTTIIKTKINVSYNPDDNSLRITGENLNWLKTIENSSWGEELEIDMIRDMGNESDITNVFERLDICLEQLNYTDKYEKCMDVNRDADNRLLACEEEVGYKQNYTDCLTQISQKDSVITEKETDKNNAVKNVQDKYDELKKQRDWIGLLAVAAGIVAGYYLLKNRGALFTKREERSNLPTRFAV